MCVYYILHAHLLIMNQILEMFTWKTNVLSVFSPLLYPSFLIFSCILFFYIWDPCISLYILWKPAIKTIIIIIIITFLPFTWVRSQTSSEHVLTVGSICHQMSRMT